MPNIKKILIANRGEIALRIMRSLKEMQIKTVAIYSEADRHAPYVRYADEAVCVGPPSSSASYLNVNNILEAARSVKADAIHPGYGFLSENADFARKVQEGGIIFIGPSPEAIAIMGSKLAAKAAVAPYDIPLIPGTSEPLTDMAKAREKAAEIGYPILIKASAGGGGKGMRIVNKEKDLEAEMERAVSEAKSAFGDGAVFIEKFIESPRHIEIQVMGDQHGNIIHLFERECSVQRRYQKVIEEAPSAVVTPSLREAMGKAAIEVAKACNYYGAGTVEFVVDEALNFYFLEMNTRLQVEHPVTELITGIDLVKEQVRIAEGKTLSLQQDDLHIHGHAIEIRVYAEDPVNNFLPDTGTLHTYVRPQGPGIRVDDGFEQGMEIPVFYDPMIAKLIVHAGSREEAIQRMSRAIDEYQISGVATTLSFCKFVLQHEAFTSGNFNTKFVDQYFKPEFLNVGKHPAEEKIAATLAAYLYQHQQPANASVGQATNHKESKWKLRKL
jgi:acetyl-CoA carboxylase, biotin carboxylase subunit